MMTSTVAEVESINPLTDSVLQFVLKPKEFIDYHAGQYLQILSNGDAYPFSIANAPLGSHKLELHIRHTKENPYNQELLDEVKSRGHVTIDMPFGECEIGRLDKDKDIVFIAGGTGFAPVKAMIEQLLADADSRAIHVFWGARNLSDLYLNEMVEHWHNSVSHFHYHRFIEQRKTNKLVQSIVDEFGTDLNKMQIVACGPFAMVYTARDFYVARGFDKNNMFSDAFAFEQGD